MATWVITGANRGLGLEFAKQLLAEGHTIIAGVRSPEAMDFHHEQMIVYQLDVASTTSVETFAKNVKSSVSSIDVLVNNAGRMDGRWQSLEEVDPELSLNVLNVNTIGLFAFHKPYGRSLKVRNQQKWPTYPALWARLTIV